MLHALGVPRQGRYSFRPRSLVVLWGRITNVRMIASQAREIGNVEDLAGAVAYAPGDGEKKKLN